MLWMLVFVWVYISIFRWVSCFFFFQAEDGIRDLVRSRGLGDVYKRQVVRSAGEETGDFAHIFVNGVDVAHNERGYNLVAIDAGGTVLGREGFDNCFLYTTDAADERSMVDLGGGRFL